MGEKDHVSPSQDQNDMFGHGHEHEHEHGHGHGVELAIAMVMVMVMATAEPHIVSIQQPIRFPLMGIYIPKIPRNFAPALFPLLSILGAGKDQL